MKPSIAGSLRARTFCQARAGTSAPPSLCSLHRKQISSRHVGLNIGGLLICGELGGWLCEIGDANVQLLRLDSDEWRGEEGLHGWVPLLGASVLIGLSCIPVPVPAPLGRAGQEGGALQNKNASLAWAGTVDNRVGLLCVIKQGSDVGS